MKPSKKFDNLAQFVFHTRENLGLSVQGLSRKINLDESIISNIESGLELCLSSTVRQKLAKGLRVSLDEIKLYEKAEDYNFVSKNKIDELRQMILDNMGNKGFVAFCPVCGSKLNTRIAKLYDLEDNLIFHPKANCTKCPFQLHS